MKVFLTENNNSMPPMMGQYVLFQMLQVRMPNLFGRAERLSCDYTYGTKSAVGYGASFYKPLGGNPDLT